MVAAAIAAGGGPAVAQVVAGDLPRVNRDNYMHMAGDALKRYAHSLGISRSEAAGMSDEKLKEQCRIAISRHYDEES